MRFCPDVSLSSVDPPRRSGIFNSAQDLVPGTSRKVREKEQEARHREHASQHRPTVASVSCNGDAESRTIEFILHNIIHKYHVVGSVHESRNPLSNLLTAYFLDFFFFLARTACMFIQSSTPNPPNAPNASKCRPASWLLPPQARQL